MKSNLVLSLVGNILWLFVGGMLAFWVGLSAENNLPWLIIGILIVIIGSIGINQVVAKIRKKK